MPKKLNDHNTNKGRSESKHQGRESHKERGEMGRGVLQEGRERLEQERPDGLGDRQQRQPGLGRLLQNARGFRRDNQGGNMNDGKFRTNNCLSRVLMLALPLVALGAFLFGR